jgi:hypothetical protein
MRVVGYGRATSLCITIKPNKTLCTVATTPIILHGYACADVHAFKAWLQGSPPQRRTLGCESCLKRLQQTVMDALLMPTQPALQQGPRSLRLSSPVNASLNMVATHMPSSTNIGALYPASQA